MALDLNLFTQDHVQALSARSGEPIIDDQTEKEARYALASIFELVLFYGSSEWNINTLPGVANQVLIEASARLFMNLGGFVQERADAVSLSRLEEYAQGAHLTQAEIERLERAAGKLARKGTLQSIPVQAVTTIASSQFQPYEDYWFQPVSPFHSTDTPAIPYLPGDDLRHTIPLQSRTPRGEM